MKRFAQRLAEKNNLGVCQVWTRLAISAVVLIVSAVFLFARLGHYALWDDEASTALHAQGVLRTGDTSAVIGHNIVAPYNGIYLRNLRERYLPPLQSYLAAPFIGLLGSNALAPRLPFACCGLLTVGLILWWLWKDSASLETWVLTGMAITGNVSLFLFCRQSRYYAAGILGCTVLAYLYRHWTGRAAQLIAFVTASLALFATQYLIFLGSYLTLAVDYLIWGRKELKLTWRQVVAFVVPHVVVCGTIAAIWNPFATQPGVELPHHTWLERGYLFYGNFRDAIACEFYVGALVLAAPVLYFFRRDVWLLRALVALVTYNLAVAVFSPQSVRLLSDIAGVRYLVPLMILGVFLDVRVLRSIPFLRLWMLVPLAGLAFGTNLLHGGMLTKAGFRSTVAQYVQELVRPPTDPFTVASRWINQHVADWQSVWVTPNYTTYPLMYHSPQAIYAWQLTYPPREQFKSLALIHFKGVLPPDYIIAFGPAGRQVAKMIESARRADFDYERVAVLDVYWHDLHRPELFWRSFGPINSYDRDEEAVFVFRHKK